MAGTGHPGPVPDHANSGFRRCCSPPGHLSRPQAPGLAVLAGGAGVGHRRPLADVVAGRCAGVVAAGRRVLRRGTAAGPAAGRGPEQSARGVGAGIGCRPLLPPHHLAAGPDPVGVLHLQCLVRRPPRPALARPGGHGADHRVHRRLRHQRCTRTRPQEHAPRNLAGTHQPGADRLRSFHGGTQPRTSSRRGDAAGSGLVPHGRVDLPIHVARDARRFAACLGS